LGGISPEAEGTVFSKCRTSKMKRPKKEIALYLFYKERDNTKKDTRWGRISRAI